MASKFLGKGWKFPIAAQDGNIEVAEYEESIRDSIWLILSTAKGERVMRPDFGCRAPQLVFAPGGQRYLRLLETTVREAIRDWEPRVDLLDVAVEADIEEPERVQVSVAYRVRATNTRLNLVFPFYLETLEVG